MDMSLIAQLGFLILFLGFFVFFVVQAYNMVFRGYAPFLASGTKIIKRIIDELDLADDVIVYELGAGRAGFLRALRKKLPQAKLVGVEYSWLPYALGQIQNWLTNSRIKIIKKNIFTIDLSEPNLVYCYLNEGTMKRLEEVFIKECRPGMTVVSYQFSLPNKKADKVIQFEGSKDRVFIYRY